MLRRRCFPRPGAEHGQVVGFTVVMAVAMIAMGAFVIDVGSWLRAHRSAQATADAAALAGAQALPADQGTASAVALDYANKNDGGVAAGDITFQSKTFAGDTISVKARRTSPGFLARVLGVDAVQVSADSRARAYNMSAGKYAAPFAVERSHPMISGGGCPCFGQSTELELNKVGPGAFKVINLDSSRGGVGQAILASWILYGFDGYLDKDWYYSDPGAKFNPGQVQDALTARIGSELLFPIYDQQRRQGANFEYRVIGFVGFRLTGYEARGNNGFLYGAFTRVTWEGVATESSQDFYGASVVKLVG